MREEIIKRATALQTKEDLGNLVHRISKKRIVMLGEASHGTKDFYDWRRQISLDLIKNHGFQFIAVEGDWPACQNIHHFITNSDNTDAISVMNSFSRWPTWMWANAEILDLMDELREWNDTTDNSIGFHGLDVYSLFESMDFVLETLKEFDQETYRRARDLYSCFDPYLRDERAYARSLYRHPEGCEKQVALALKEVLRTNLQQDQIIDVSQNARIVKNAERYYHSMLTQDEDSWNVRDRHMMETLEMLLGHYGPEAKGIVWAHNTHIGDYRGTDMLISGQVNIGGLAREQFGQDQVALVGFSTYQGEVIASGVWDGPVETMTIPRGRPGSLEDELHQACEDIGHTDYILDCEELDDQSPFHEWIGHRAIGVVYRPEHERRGNYVPTCLAKRYDHLIYIDYTHALTPLNVRFQREKIPETYPFGNRL